MLLNTLKYKKSIFVLVLIIAISLNVVKIALGFFYLKNGNSVSINNYQIEFPFLHWAYFGESKITHLVVGRSIDKSKLKAEFFKNTETIDIKQVTTHCDSLNEIPYSEQNLQGTLYICSQHHTEIMYFQSKDKQLFLREQSYNSSNIEIVNEYNLLFASIQKIKEVP